MKLIFIILGLLLVVVSVLYFIPQQTPEEESYQGPVPQGYDLDHFRETGETEQIYKGPVPQGYDLKHFRETGETKLMVNEDG